MLSSAGPEKTYSGKTILLVEDEALIAMEEAEILKKHKFNVITVYNAKKAFQIVREKDIDLILMDINLGNGEMDGTSAALEILKEHDIPLIFLSSHTEAEVVEKTEGITSYGYIVKNSGETVLIASVKMAFRLYEARRTERQKERELKRSTALYRNLMENSIDAVYLLDREGKVLNVNNVACKMFGYSREELLQLTIDDIDPNFPKPAFIAFWDKKTEGQTLLFETLHKHKNGDRIPVEVNGIFFTLEGKKFLFGVARNISERKKAEERLMAIADYTYGWEDWIETDGRLIWVNPGVERITGYSPEDCYAMPDYPYPLVHEEDCEITFDDISRSLQQETSYQNREVRCKCKNGTIKWISISWQPIYDKDGNLLGIRSSMRDINDLKKSETELKKALSDKDFLLKELHHRVKNNLTMISSLLSLKGATPGKDSSLKDIIQQIDTIRILYDKFNQSEEIGSIDVEEYFSEILEAVLSSLPQYEVAIEKEIEHIFINSKDAVLLGLIVNEIATNAVKHGFIRQRKGVFRVSFKEDISENEYILRLFNNGAPFPEHVNLSHPDTLGLRLILALVEQLEGSIELQRKPNPLFIIRFRKER